MNAVETWIPSLCWTITISLLHLVWIGGLIGSVTVVAIRCMAGRSANAKYLIYVMSLVTMFLSVPTTLGVVAVTQRRSDLAIAEPHQQHNAGTDVMVPDVRDRPIGSVAELTFSSTREKT